MFDSPIAYCDTSKKWVSLAQTLEQCATRNNCAAPGQCRLATCLKKMDNVLPVKLNVSLAGAARSEALNAYIQAQADKLHALHPAVTETSVTLELLSRHHLHGNDYKARLEMRLPGHCVGIDHVSNPDAYAALREAFNTAHRRLSDAKRDVSDFTQASMPA